MAQLVHAGNPPRARWQAGPHRPHAENSRRQTRLFRYVGAARRATPCELRERGVQCAELPLTAQLSNFAAGLKDGLPYQPWAAELVKNRSKDAAYIDPHIH